MTNAVQNLAVSGSYGEIEKPPVEFHGGKKEGTAMTREKRLDSLAMVRSLLRHPYGFVFKNVDFIRRFRPESLAKLEKPMDLETVTLTLKNKMYSTVEAFAEDVRRVFSDAKEIFPATDEVHKMATTMSQKFEMGFKIEVESLNPEPETPDNKEPQGKKTDPSAAAASDGGKEMCVVRRESVKKYRRVSVSRAPSAKEKDETSLDFTIASRALHWKLESDPATYPTREARVAALLERFSRTIKKAEKELAAKREIEWKARMKIEAQIEREMEDKLKRQRKRDRSALETYLFPES